MFDNDRDLKRNGSGYYDPTAYKAIKQADVFYDKISKAREKELKKYIKEKKQLLKDFAIKLTDEQIAYLDGLTREIDIDNFAHDLIVEALKE